MCAKRSYIIGICTALILAAHTSVYVGSNSNTSLRRTKDVLPVVYSDSDLEFRSLHIIKDGNLYNGFGTLISPKGEFDVRFDSGEIDMVFGGSTIRSQWYSYLIDEQGNLWHGPNNLGNVDFIGTNGNLIFDKISNQLLMIGGQFVRGSYTGINLQRDSDAQLFDIMPSEEDVARLREYVAPGKDAIGVVIDLDTDPPGDYMAFAETMAVNPDITILLPYLDIYRPGQSFYLRGEDVARRGLTGLLQSEWSTFGGQSAGKYVMRIVPYLEMMVGASIEDIRNSTFTSGNENVSPRQRSEDLHETAAIGDGIQGAYNLDSADFEDGRIPDDNPIIIYRQLFLTSKGELDIERLFRPYTENYKDDNKNVQDNLALVFVDDTENVELRDELIKAIATKAHELGVDDKVFYFHRVKDPAWRGIDEGYMRKIGRIIWINYFLQTGKNQSGIFSSNDYDYRETDSQDRMWLNSELYIDAQGILCSNDGTVVERERRP